MYSDRRGNGQKQTRTKPSRQKTKTPGQKPPRTNETEFAQGAFVRAFCTRHTKNRGVRDMWRTFGGVSGCVTKCDSGEGGSKLAKNSMTYFMDGPIFTDWNTCENKNQGQKNEYRVMGYTEKKEIAKTWKGRPVGSKLGGRKEKDLRSYTDAGGSM